MKISTNNVGNYSPGLRVSNDYQKAAVEQKQNMKLSILSPESTAITNDEKNFFLGLYPDSRNEIVDYHFYQKSGKMSGVQIGSQFDRRG